MTQPCYLNIWGGLRGAHNWNWNQIHPARDTVLQESWQTTLVLGLDQAIFQGQTVARVFPCSYWPAARVSIQGTELCRDAVCDSQLPDLSVRGSSCQRSRTPEVWASSCCSLWCWNTHSAALLSVIALKHKCCGHFLSNLLSLRERMKHKGPRANALCRVNRKVQCGARRSEGWGQAHGSKHRLTSIKWNSPKGQMQPPQVPAKIRDPEEQAWANMTQEAEGAARGVNKWVGACCHSAQSLIRLKNSMCVCVCVAHEKWMYSWADLRGLMLWVSVTLSGGDKHQMHQKWWLKPSEGSNYEMRWPGCRFLCSWAEGEGLSRRFFCYPFQSCFLLILANAAWKAPGMFALPSSELPVSGT